MSRKLLVVAALAALIVIAGTRQSQAAATITILVNDAAGVGFNDPTPVAPVGGNTGTTLGQQRLIAFQHAANIWGATLTSVPAVTVRAQWSALTCTATSAVLGSAGAISVSRDFGGAPFATTWYHAALANKLTGTDGDPVNPEINANFNVNLGNTGCLTGSPFYLGLDSNHGASVDLVAVLLHEFAHGLGFSTFTSSSTGTVFSSFPAVTDRFLFDGVSGKTWLSMTASERVASAINSNLAWLGPRANAAVPGLLANAPFLKVTVGATTTSYSFGTAIFGPALANPPLTGAVVQGLDPSDAAGTSTTDACSALTNAAAVAGKIAIVDRGSCGFVVKVKNAQNAGAIGVIVANNAAGILNMAGTDPTITIPTVLVSQADGATIVSQIPQNPSAQLGVDAVRRAGTDDFGRPLMYAPNPVAPGSSVSHWDISMSPNQLMEPNINTDLTQAVTLPGDLTFEMLQDIGWGTTSFATALAPSGGNSQTANVNNTFPQPLQVALTGAGAGQVVTFTAPTSGASGTFANSGNFTGNLLAAPTLTLNSRVATAVTDAGGVATAPAFTANGTAGTFSVVASVAGGGSTSFSLTTSNVPTAATVGISGRVLNQNGRPIRGATVSLLTADGTILTAKTSAFGRFAFANLPVDQTYVLGVSAKRMRFAPQVISLVDELTGLDLYAQP